MQELGSVSFYSTGQFIGEEKVEMISITGLHKGILVTIELPTVLRGDGYEIIAAVQYVLLLILCS